MDSSDPPAFVIRSSEGKRTSVAPEDLPAYLASRDAILDALRRMERRRDGQQ